MRAISHVHAVWVLVVAMFMPLDSQVRGQYSHLDPAAKPAAAAADSSHLTQYLLQKLLQEGSQQQQQSEREAAEERIFSERGDVVYPQRKRVNEDNPIRRYLDEAKEQIDVIDFRRATVATDNKNKGDELLNQERQDSDLSFSDGVSQQQQPKQQPSRRSTTKGSSGSASEQVPVKLAFPGNDFEKATVGSAAPGGGCTNCVPEGSFGGSNRWSMPLQRLGNKQYYLGIFFKANWYKAEQYCRFHGMHLASINSAEEQKDLQDHIQAYGMGQEHFWTSGTDQAEEGKFFWLSTGRPITYTNWNAGEPNNFTYEDGEKEHCLEIWDRDGKGLAWNDTPCSFQTFFICEASQ